MVQFGGADKNVCPGIKADKNVSPAKLYHYRWVLENSLQDQLAELRKVSDKQTVVLLDYQTNGDIEDLSRPLSHAALIKRFLQDDWPD